MRADEKASAAAKVLVVDDDTSLLALLTTVLESAGFNVTAVGTGEAALVEARRRRPAAVILDVHLPGISGYEVFRELSDSYHGALPIIFISGERTETFDRVAGLLLGADDYLVKPFAPDELIARVRAVMRRATPTMPERIGRLTPREHEVLGLLARGLDQREIAAKLVISPKTVASHIERILEKLGVHSRAQAVAVAHLEELVSTVP